MHHRHVEAARVRRRSDRKTHKKVQAANIEVSENMSYLLGLINNSKTSSLRGMALKVISDDALSRTQTNKNQTEN